MNDPHAAKKSVMPPGFVFLGYGPLDKVHFEERGDNLAIWGEERQAWRFIECQGSAKAIYAARENSQAHLTNLAVMKRLETECPMDDGEESENYGKPSSPGLPKFIFTFGSGHHHGPEQKSLENCYTWISAEDKEVARATMSELRGDKWAFVTDEAEGWELVKKWSMTYVSIHDLKPQEGATF